MSTDDRVQALYRTVPAGADVEHRTVLLAGLAQLESATAAALSLYVQGEPGALDHLFGPDGAGLVGMPVVAAFAAAAEALGAAVGDDPARGYAALATLQERAAEYAAAHELMTRRADGNAP